MGLLINDQSKRIVGAVSNLDDLFTSVMIVVSVFTTAILRFRCF